MTDGTTGPQLSTDIIAKGFGAQVDPGTGLTFYVSAGLGGVTNGFAANAKAVVNGNNANGAYSETLTFTLLAGY
jgi:hypothetical protein